MVNIFKKIQEEYYKKITQLKTEIAGYSIGYIIDFLKWKGLIQQNDWEKYCQFKKVQIKYNQDMQWLKENLDKIDINKKEIKKS